MKRLLKYIAQLLNEKITGFTPVSGGDISQTYKLQTLNKNYFLKVNSGASVLQMFKAEKKGLECITASQTIAVPQVYEIGIYEGQGFLLMELIESKIGSEEDFQTLARQLASMHQFLDEQFGFEQNNFIASLNQSNTYCDNWSDFYLYQRLQPQLDLAMAKGLLSTDDIPKKEVLQQELDPYFNNVKPSLLHGDLWNGNFLFGQDGTPYLIDPAIYYGHHEVDLAMTRLFGGFPRSFYDSYHEIIPQSAGTEARIELYQLYYLLVHLNLFGSSYLGAVRRILERYF